MNEWKKPPLDHLLRTKKNGERQFTDEEIETFGRAIETGYVVGDRLQLMFHALDAVRVLAEMPAGVPVAVTQSHDDPELARLETAAEHAGAFLQAIQPLITQAKAVAPHLAEVEAFLKANRGVRTKRRSLTPKKLIAKYVKKVQAASPRGTRLGPKDVAAFVKATGVDEVIEGPDASSDPRRATSSWRDTLKEAQRELKREQPAKPGDKTG